MEDQHWMMNFMMELDNNIRYFRTGIQVCDEERMATKQLVVYLSACKQMNLKSIMYERTLLKNEIGNMLYVMMESGKFTPEFATRWTNIIHQTNKYFNICLNLEKTEKGTTDEMSELIDILVVP